MENKVSVITDTALQLQVKAELDNQVSTAKAFPRQPLKEVLEEIFNIATITPETVESCMYAVPRKKRNEVSGQWEDIFIEGPSVRLAEIVASSYGNLRAGRRIIENNGKTIVAQGICHDLQKNYAVTVEITKKITNASGQSFSDDMQILTGNAASSIAFRNAVFSVVPKSLVNTVYEKLREIIKGNKADLDKRMDRAFKWFEKNNVPEEKVLKVLGKKHRSEVTTDDMAIMTGMKAALSSGAHGVKEMFDQRNPVDEKKEALKTKQNNNPNETML